MYGGGYNKKAVQFFFVTYCRRSVPMEGKTMLRQFTKFALISGLVFSAAAGSYLPLRAEENGTEEILAETPEETVEETAEEITEVVSEAPEETAPAAEEPAEAPVIEETPEAPAPVDETDPEVVEDELTAIEEGSYTTAYYAIPEELEDPGVLLGEAAEAAEEAGLPTIEAESEVITANPGDSVSLVYIVTHNGHTTDRCVIQVYNPDGRLVARSSHDFHSTYKKTKYSVKWHAGENDAGRYTVKAYMMYNTDGTETGWKATPLLLTSYIDLGVAPTPTPSASPEPINEFFTIDGKDYWYEDGVRQGTYDDPKGVMGDGTVRGREICDFKTQAWYWLDAVYDGAKAVNKEVWMPYIFQDEKTMTEEKKEAWRTYANTYTEDPDGTTAEMGNQLVDAINERTGKWVRYDENGKMYKGWLTITENLSQYYPGQVGNTYYYDYATGLMAKGKTVIGGEEYFFDEKTGVLQGERKTADEEEEDSGSAVIDYTGWGEPITENGKAIVEAAYAQLGSTDLCSVVANNALKAIGVDCMVYFPFGGYMLSTETVRDAGTRVDTPQPGDIAFYASNYSGTSSHVAVYVGEGKVVSGNFNGSTQLVAAYIGGQQSQPEYYRYY